MYYLINRYYDPETGRFLSADDVSYLDPETIGGLNLYAYCNNNPVMNIDPEGTFFLTALLIGALVGVAIGGTVAGIKAAEEGLEGWDIVGEVAKGALIGGATGAVGGAGIGLIGAGAAAIGGGSMALIGGATLSGGAATVAATGAIVVGAGATAAAGALSLGALNHYLFSVQRMGPNRHSNNQAEIKYIDYLQKKYKFSDKIRRLLHDEITSKRYNKQQVEEILKDILGL